MQEIAVRNATDFEKFYERHWKYVYRLCFTYMNNAADAEDCTEDVFVKVFNGKFGFEDEKSIKYKCDFIKKESLLGGMYWEYSIDTLFVKIVANNLLIPHTYR